GQPPVAVAAGGSTRGAPAAMVGKGIERALGHGVDRERRRESFDVKRVGGRRILGSGAGPQQALRAGARIGEAIRAVRSQSFAVELVGAPGDRQAEAGPEVGGGPFLYCDGPTA